MINTTRSGVTQGTFSTSPPPDFIPINFNGEDQEFSPPLRGLSWATDGVIVMDLVGSPQARYLPTASLALKLQHGMQIKKIFNAGTTATGLIGWW